MSKIHDTNRLLKILAPYCDKIRTGKHIVVYPKGTNQILAISKTSSDWNRNKQVLRDFRKLGIIIKELENKNL
jgi:hypothetical protein